MQNIVFNSPRSLRSHVARLLGGENKLFLLSPKQSGDKRGLWRFAALYLGKLIVLGKGCKTRDQARLAAPSGYGVKAYEPRAKRERKLAA